MLSISHTVTGAFIAVKVGNPVLAIPLILLSHYLEDAIPHWDVGTGLTKGVKSPLAAIHHELLDLGLATILLILMFRSQGTAPYWGAFIGLIPDFLEAPRNFWRYEPTWLAPINRFHHSFHHSIPRVLDGLAPQILLLTLLWLLH
ncbi:hypothetical protein COT87_02295 [Candidatus Collierbacteria bacterium CG10_big_fil_rev_8_21_14_0_10_44_9]|uniref:Uncharacterized protein n=1 Tax=Candidatus Collierbacteria bacterium CG10_big_fil_rev_8_21_14_0_10_44_9 TaxID=1974535 RepID=A0A2H0VKK7_9BACT|nr:MAG: hypothetical protein COT87_02295 [Candidatus Collierbacteria bacterium CG10_big_fil_rev_8_21_14_0_10_44_9]